MKARGTLSYEKGAWVIEAQADVMLRLKRVFGKIGTHQHGKATLTDTIDTARDIEWFMERYPLDASPEVKARLGGQANKHRERAAAVEQILLQVASTRKFDLAVPLREYQKPPIEIVLARGSLLLCDEMGVGKTPVGIGLVAEAEARPALVVAPKAVQRQWERQIKRFAPGLSTHILKKGTPYDLGRQRGKKKSEGQQTLPSIPTLPDVIITTSAKLPGWSEALAGSVRTLVLDECQEFRNGDETAKGAAVKHIRSRVAYALGLTGTPIHGQGSEMYQVTDLISPGSLGERHEFLNEWCGSGFAEKVKDPKAFGSFLRAEGIMLRRTRADVGRELPGISRIFHDIDINESAIDEVESAATELAKVILAAGERFDRMKASGELSYLLRQATGVGKAPHVADFVRMIVEQDEPVVLSGWHRECFARGTPVLMSDGTIRAVEAVAVGDEVMGPDSKPRRVLSLSRGRREMFRVTPNKGQSWVCSAGHTLALWRTEGRYKGFVQMTAQEFAALKPRDQRGLALYRRGVTAFAGEARVREPWLMGYWLGDGAANLATFRVASPEPEVAAECEAIAAKYGLKVKVYVCKKGTTPCHFYDLTKVKPGPSRNPLTALFRSFGLHNNKHIPHSYLTAPLADRRELLAGIIDSDGHVHQAENSKGTVEVGAKKREFAEQIAFLARSLGLAAYVKQTVVKVGNGGYGKPGDVHHVVCASGDLTQLPMRVARKRAPIRRQIKNVLHTGLALEALGEDDFYGFEVDGDNLFLLGDFTVVHNCYSIWNERLAAYKPVMVTGSESDKQKDDAMQEFIAGRSRVIIISLRSAAGLDGLQYASKTIVHGELDWSPAVMEQVDTRVYRDGQKDPVFAYYLVSQDGSDPVVQQALRGKGEQLEGIRDPDAEFFEKLQTDDSVRVRSLAEAFLARRARSKEVA